jgi:hypothetical protein
MSFLQKLEQASAVAKARDSDPWRPPLERLRGHIGDDGVERITTQVVLDVLVVPQSQSSWQSLAGRPCASAA